MYGGDKLGLPCNKSGIFLTIEFIVFIKGLSN